MQSRCTLLLNVLVALGLLLPGALVDSPFSAGTHWALASAPAVYPEEIGGSALMSARGQRKQDRRDDRRNDRAQERQRDRKHADRKHDRKQKHHKAASRVGDWETFCTGPESIQLTKSEGCTHGPDPAPQGFDVEQLVPPLSGEAEAAALTPIACDGDGRSGSRVQVLYVRGSDVSSRYARYLTSIQDWAGQADTIFQTSAAATGAGRSLRFVQDPTSCQPLVEEVVLSPNGDSTVAATMAELKSKGYSRTDRIYLAFVDTTSAGICGVGTIWSDDRANGNDNWNNVGPGCSRVDAGCWSGTVAAHEVMHNLGGVQLSAPNSSGGFHCIDEYDVMCYKDSASSPDTRRDCPSLSNDKTRFDCGHQDYYHTNPAPGSYLASFWNPANNRFLIGATPLPPPPSPPVTAAPINDATHDKKSKKKNNGKPKHGKGNKHKKKH